MKKRSGAYIFGCLFLSGVMSFILGGFPKMTSQASHASKAAEDSMNLAFKTETESRQIPPMDAAAPSVFKTASFGLG